MLKTHIFYNKPALDIVCSPYLVGSELEEKAFQASREFFKTIGKISNPLELIILEGGKHYKLSDAYENLYGIRPAYAHMDSKRKLAGKWIARITKVKLDELKDNQTILIGDTIATGVSLQYVLDTVNRYADNKGMKLGPVKIFTIAGSKKCEKRLEALDMNIEIYYANAAYDLADNGTDLLFEGADYDKKAREEIHKRLDGFDTKMKCAIWDWGDRFRNPHNHLEEIYGYYSGVNAPQWLMEEIEKRMASIPV